LNGVAEDLDGLPRPAIQTPSAVPWLRCGCLELSFWLCDWDDGGGKESGAGSGCFHGDFLLANLIGGILSFFR
jgi:hypothetical protein